MKDWGYLLGVVVGVQLTLGGMRLWESDPVLGAALLTLSAAAFCLVARSYAAGRGHSRWWGLLGCLGLPGLLVLQLLSRRTVPRSPLEGWPADLVPLTAVRDERLAA